MKPQLFYKGGNWGIKKQIVIKYKGQYKIKIWVDFSLRVVTISNMFIVQLFTISGESSIWKSTKKKKS